MLTHEDVLARWKRLAGDDSPDTWNSEDDVSGLLEAFSPTGDGSEAIFADMEFGERIAPRLREVYDATRHGPPGLYMIPTPQEPLSRQRVQELLASHVRKWLEIARFVGAEEAIETLSSLPTVEWADSSDSQEEEGKDWETYLLDVRIDFLERFDRLEHPASLLREALYRATTSPAVQDYVLWPLCADGSPVDDPFLEDFLLWKGGLWQRCKDKKTTIVCPWGS
jgi:hypothetical protein